MNECGASAILSQRAVAQPSLCSVTHHTLQPKSSVKPVISKYLNEDTRALGKVLQIQIRQTLYVLFLITLS